MISFDLMECASGDSPNPYADAISTAYSGSLEMSFFSIITSSLAFGSGLLTGMYIPAMQFGSTFIRPNFSSIFPRLSGDDEGPTSHVKFFDFSR